MQDPTPGPDAKPGSDIPDTIGPYVVAREIGRGGMGVVYLARDTKLDRDVAIKALPEELAEDADRLARFEREAKTLAQLSHPNIAGIHGLEEQAGQRYLILEYVEGESLAERLDRGPLAPDDAVRFASQIAAGLAAAHDAGIVHRDLKPDNIRITPNEQIKVLDFGLARADGATTTSATGTEIRNAATLTSPAVIPGGHSPTMPGVILGTAAYMSPEQARGRRVDKRTDTWSFGVVLFEMLAGASPFAGETVSDSIGAVLHKDIDLSRLPEGTPPAVERVLRRCLVRDRERRYHDIRDAVLDLDGVEGDVEARRRAPMGLIVGIAAVALLAGAALSWLVGDAIGPAPEKPGVGAGMALSIPLHEGHEVYGPIAISHDGATIAFTANDPFGVGTLYLRDIDGFELREVPRSRDSWSPFFSPDGSSVAFISEGELRRAPVSGGSSRTLAEAMTVIGGAWLPNGEIVYSTGVGGGGLLRVRDDGTPMEPLLPLPKDGPDYAYVWPQLIPGADKMLFTAWVSREGRETGTAGARLLDLASGRQRAFGAGRSLNFVHPVRWSGSGHAVFEASDAGLQVAPFDPSDEALPSQAATTLLLPDVAHLGNDTRSVFDLSRNGTLVYVPRPQIERTLVWVSADGSVEPVLTQNALADARLGGNVELSSDGLRALVGGAGDIVEVDLARGFPTSITREANNQDGFYVGADERIGFRSNRAQGWALWTIERKPNAQPELVVRGKGSIFDADDLAGEGFVFIDDRDLYVVDADGEVRPLVVSPNREVNCDASPDGSLVAYQSDASGPEEVYVLPVDGSALPTRITTMGGQSPKWAPDGTALYYRRGRTVMRIAMKGASPVGDPEQVFAAKYLVKGTSYDINADGTRMLAIQEDADALQDEIRVITNYFDDIERAAAGGRQ